jgi:hypothetical protein
MSGAYPCCCHAGASGGSSGPQLACQVCLPGTSPPRYRVDIAGMKDRAAFICDDCEALDGSYFVEQTIGGCWYVVNFPDICGYNRLELLVAAWGYYVSFYGLNTGAGPLAFQRLGLSAPRDCRADGLSLSPEGFFGRCTHQTATCVITAVM